MPAEPGVERGCGESRTEGGVYLESALQKDGLPLEAFLFDPPIPLTQDQLASIPRVGVTLVDGPDGNVHVIDWVGQAGYPVAPDFLEEGRRKGFSRKVSSQIEVSRLTPGKSMIYFVHPFGFLHNWEDYHQHQGSSVLDHHCSHKNDPKRHGLGLVPGPSEEHCIRHLWAAAPEQDGYPHGRAIADVEYKVYPPDAALTPAYVPAFVACVPITNFTVVKAGDDSHAQTLAKMRDATRYPVIESEA